MISLAVVWFRYWTNVFDFPYTVLSLLSFTYVCSPSIWMKNMGRNIVHILKLCLCLFSHKFVLIKKRMTLMTKLNRTVVQQRKHSEFLGYGSVVA